MIRYWPICHLKIKSIPTFLCRYNIFYGNISDLRLATFCASRLFLPFARQTRPYDTSANFWAFDTCPAWDEVHDNHKKSACSPWGEALLVWGSQARWHWGWTPTCQNVIIVCSWIVKALVVVKIIILINSKFLSLYKILVIINNMKPHLSINSNILSPISIASRDSSFDARLKSCASRSTWFSEEEVFWIFWKTTFSKISKEIFPRKIYWGDHLLPQPVVLLQLLASESATKCSDRFKICHTLLSLNFGRAKICA